MVIKQDEMKVVVAAVRFNNNPGWIQTQEDDLNLLVETMWEARFEYNSISAILESMYGSTLLLKKG